MIKNTLPDKSGIPKPSKHKSTARKLFNYCVHSWRGFVKGVRQGVLFAIF